MDRHGNTHDVVMGQSDVLKRYRAWTLDEPAREWRALGLLSRHAPGLAPVPLAAGLGDEPPWLRMSRLDGVSITGPVQDAQLSAIAAAVLRLHTAVPARTLHEIPPRAGHPLELLRRVRAWCESFTPPSAGAETDPEAEPDVAAAYNATAAWAHGRDLERTLAASGTPVLGTGDGNVANYLWDGGEVRLVDFEYAGRSDRAYELAEVVEHISAWWHGGTGLDRVVDAADLSGAEARRLVECRRLLASFWFFRVVDHTKGAASRLLKLL
ncbi:phosphotransferase family protein [Actinomadura gamaensis]|uniref:Phosphotransferase family protein n=1 Tax=Actinomadura gamaensis TaxID=1763541 RepID=A0ABV9U845_9ACTN